MGYHSFHRQSQANRQQELQARKVGRRGALHVIDVLVRCRAIFNMWASELSLTSSPFGFFSLKQRGGVDGRQTCVTTFVNTDILTYMCDLWTPRVGAAGDCAGPCRFGAGGADIGSRRPD